MEDLTSLVERAQNGQTDAWEELVRRFQDMAVGYAYSVFGDFHEAEDAAQDAFVSALGGSKSLCWRRSRPLRYRAWWPPASAPVGKCGDASPI
ncbi:MAG: hypothetical protein HN796_26225, partial [Gemmatimonadetes bacterium]|nr:hypothetical protein [Gemmatimonadota bacterium]